MMKVTVVTCLFFCNLGFWLGTLRPVKPGKLFLLEALDEKEIEEEGRYY